MRIKNGYYVAKDILAVNPVPPSWKGGPRKWCKYIIGMSKAYNTKKRKEGTNETKQSKENKKA